MEVGEDGGKKEKANKRTRTNCLINNFSTLLGLNSRMKWKVDGEIAAEEAKESRSRLLHHRAEGSAEWIHMQVWYQNAKDL
jgi:hypothetical protein